MTTITRLISFIAQSVMYQVATNVKRGVIVITVSFAFGKNLVVCFRKIMLHIILSDAVMLNNCDVLWLGDLLEREQ